MSGLYQSGYTPARTPSHLDRTSMSCDGKGQAGDVLRRKGVLDEWGNPLEVVGWFNDAGHLIQLVADYANGRRVEFRQRVRDWTLRIWTPHRGDPS